MDTQCAAATFGEDAEVAASLRCLRDPECVFLPGNGEIGSIIAGNLQKDAAIRAALVGLSRGVQEAWAEAKAGGDFLFVANGVTEFLQDFFVFRIHRDVAQNGEIIARSDTREMLFEYVDKFCAATESRCVLFVGEEFYPSGFEEG